MSLTRKTTFYATLLPAAKMLLLSILFLWLPLCAMAQNNPYKIDDSLYAMYMRAFRQTNDAKCLQIADSLFDRAAKMHDPKAQCMALAIKNIYYLNIKDKVNLKKITDQLKAFSKKAGLMQYYYYTSGNYINFLGNNNPSEGLEYAIDMRREAEARGDHYGIYSSMRAIANIYFARRDFYIARRRYLENIDYGNKYLRNENSAMLYARVALCCVEIEQFKEAEEYASMGLRLSKVQSTREFNLLILCISKFYTSSSKDFLNYYEKVKGTFTYRNTATANIVTWLRMLYLITKNDFDKAIQEMSQHDRSPYLYSVLYENMGNYEKALEYRVLSHDNNQMFRKGIRSLDLAAQEAQISSFMLSESNNLAQLNNALLANANASLELEQLQAEAVANNATMMHDSLEYQSKELENEHLRTAMEKNRIANLKAEKENHDTEVRMQIIVVTSVMLLLITIQFIIFRARASRRLKRLNAALTARHTILSDARRRAEDADKIKTLFLQNMSHEIRTPLNAIVGFSQIIADGGISDDEKADFAQRIEENSDIVQNIINAILDLTSIESGHYKMMNTLTSVNEMCRNAMAEVADHMPSGVMLKLDTEVPDDFAIVTDRRRVTEVLINLLTNAEKYTESGSITVQCSTTENLHCLTLAVADTGVGIPADKTEAIFGRFYKLDDFKQGVGLGLTICRAIAEHLGGKIFVDTTHTPGARLVLLLPLK